MQRINNTDRAALVNKCSTFLERWQKSGLDQRQFISRYRKEIDWALISEPGFLGSPSSSAKPPSFSERRQRVLKALNRIEEATETLKLIPTKQSRQEEQRAMRDFGRLWFDVKLMIAAESDTTGTMGRRSSRARALSSDQSAWQELFPLSFSDGRQYRILRMSHPASSE